MKETQSKSRNTKKSKRKEEESQNPINKSIVICSVVTKELGEHISLVTGYKAGSIHVRSNETKLARD
jgi:hypothetical protein